MAMAGAWRASGNSRSERQHVHLPTVRVIVPKWMYLTTVIPYEKKNGPPSVEDLQILT
ncbi:hypothetical protein U0070_015516, partial [Myodes glareolus]